MRLSTFKIDMDDAIAIKKLCSLLQKRRKNILRNLNVEMINFGVSKNNIFDIMPILEHIHSLKLESNDEIKGNKNSYYVYVHCDPLKKLDIKRDIRELYLASLLGLTHKPFYVGKGIGERCNDLSRNEGHRKVRSKILAKNKEVQIVKILENLSEQEALFEEQKLISILGLSSLDKHGLLTNLQTDKSIIQQITDALPTFVVPEQIALKSNSAQTRIVNKYKNFISIMSNWI